jgi:hypothetical protein
MLALLVCRCLRPDAVTAPRESLWLRHNQKIRTTLETLSGKSTKSTLNPCLQTRATTQSVKWQTIGIRSAVQCPFRVQNAKYQLRANVFRYAPYERTSTGTNVMSEKCQQRTWQMREITPFGGLNQARANLNLC